jgi:short-subunit dehydrogenase
MQRLDQRTVIVTGASSGIGEAVVRRLVARGANVVLFARRAARLQALAAEVDPAGERTLAVAGDIAVEADRERLVTRAVERFGGVYALVNNAGYGQRGPVESVPLEKVRANFETNVFALLGLTQAVVPHLRQAGGGRVVNVGSVAGRIARPLTAVYDATKHAVEAFTDGLRGELKPFGIPVSLVRPGFILTEFVEAADRVSKDEVQAAGPYAPFAQSMSGSARKLKRIAGTPDDVARAIEHAVGSASPRSHYAVPGHARVFLFLKWALPTRLLDHVVRLRRG